MPAHPAETADKTIASPAPKNNDCRSGRDSIHFGANPWRSRLIGPLQRGLMTRLEALKKLMIALLFTVLATMIFELLMAAIPLATDLLGLTHGARQDVERMRER